MPARAPDRHRRSSDRRPQLLLAAAFAVLLAMLSLAVGAGAANLQGKVDSKQSSLKVAKQRKGVLTTDISRYNSQIDQLTGEVAALRNREAVVETELAAVQTEFRQEQDSLVLLRERLTRSTTVLRKRLVAIYKTDAPDALTVVLQSDGFDEVLGQYEYLQRIQGQDSDIVGRVRGLRNDTRQTVERIRADRDSIIAKKAELVRTRQSLEAKEADLASARDRSRSALGRVGGHIDDLEGEISSIQDKIQKQLAAAAAAAAEQEAASSGGVGPLPAGPIKGGSSGMIWPVNGPIVSPFGPRWGTNHNGIDIAAPAGTPIRAAKDGTVVLSQSEAESGGYGNFTCLDHGGGLQTCYAHQSSIAVSSGPVTQGQVIGYVGCTGHCFGDHLHFEVRINGAPTDPLPYL